MHRFVKVRRLGGVVAGSLLRKRVDVVVGYAVEHHQQNLQYRYTAKYAWMIEGICRKVSSKQCVKSWSDLINILGSSTSSFYWLS